MISWAATLWSTKRVLLVKAAGQGVAPAAVADAAGMVAAEVDVPAAAGPVAVADGVAEAGEIVVTAAAEAAGAGRSLPQSGSETEPGSLKAPRFCFGETQLANALAPHFPVKWLGSI
jgi:hypothetical protein